MYTMNEDAKEISDVILGRLPKSCSIVPSPNGSSISIYGSTNEYIMRIEKFNNEISMVDQYHAFRFNFGSDTESANTIWNIILTNLNFKGL